jgi:hypothetical protein
MKKLILIALFTLSACSHQNPAGRSISSTYKNDSNPGIEVISNPAAFNRVLAISDVHGMYDNLIPLLTAAKVIDAQKNWSAGKTLLVVVGDSIDKGPKSLDVIDLWISLSAQAEKQGGKLAYILGNHEAELLADPSGASMNSVFAHEISARGLTHEQVVSADSKYGKFLRSIPGFLSVGKWLFFHAGAIPDGPFPTTVGLVTEALKQGDYQNDIIIGDNSFLEQKDWAKKDVEGNLKRLDKAGYYGIVFGHKPTAFGIEGKIGFIKKRIFKIDTGMAPQAGAHTGEILEFQNPSDLMQSMTPTNVYAIGADGSKRALDSSTLLHEKN